MSGILLLLAALATPGEEIKYSVWSFGDGSYSAQAVYSGCSYVGNGKSKEDAVRVLLASFPSNPLYCDDPKQKRVGEGTIKVKP